MAAFEHEGAGGVAQRFQQLLGSPRLEDVAEDLAAVDGLDGFFQLREAGHEQAHRLRMVLPHPFQKLHARLARHLLVRQNQVYFPLSEERLCLFRTVGRQHLEFLSQERREGGQDIRLVIDHQKGAFVLAHFRPLARQATRNGLWKSDTTLAFSTYSLFLNGKPMLEAGNLTIQ